MRKLLLSLAVLFGAALAAGQAEAAPTGRLAVDPATVLAEQGAAVEPAQYYRRGYGWRRRHYYRRQYYRHRYYRRY